MTPCPDELELARAISGEEEPQITAHLASCATCRATHEGTLRAIALARQVSAPMPSAERREEVRTAILAARVTAERPIPRARRSPRIAWLGGAAFAAAAVIAIVVLSRSPSPAAGHAHATILPRPGASYVASSMSPDEIVMLHDGSIEVQVAPLHPGERFRVILADAQIEVHGTAFVATARGGHLLSVTVSHGIVEVRSTTAPPQRLVAGDSWEAPVQTADRVTAPVLAPVVIPPPVIIPPAPVAPERVNRRRPIATPVVPRNADPVESSTPAPKREPHEVAYDDAWTAMRAGMFTRAASAFARVQILDPGGPLAEDAGLWYAVALERSGQSSQAATAFRDFIDAFPASRRVGEASAMLGWILVDANEPAEAERRFRAAIGDSTPAVRDSAQAGLSAVAKMK